MSAAVPAFSGKPLRTGPANGESLTREQLLELWRRMQWIREHELLVEGLNGQGLIRGSTHLYIGMEACGVGVASALADEDMVLGHYRSHGHAIAVGVPPRTIIAEVLGRVGGCCGGRGGTKHLMAVAHNHYGSYAIVAQHLPLATGVALSLKLSAAAGSAPAVAVCFFGDGAANQGAAFEALNLAVINAVPCLFVCENNRYAVSSPAELMTGGESIAARASGFGMPAEQVDGMDVVAVREATLRARSHALDGPGPYLLELMTYRYRGHSVFQVDDRYRADGELDAWRKRDPIEQVESALSEAGVDAQELEAERDAIKATLREDADWAVAQPPLGAVTEDDMYARDTEGAVG